MITGDNRFDSKLVLHAAERLPKHHALRLKIRDDAVVRNKAVYLASGVLPDGCRDVLGLWIEQTDGGEVLGSRSLTSSRLAAATTS
jgi:hypothetical protein